jgi:hypothetical protein
MSSPDRIDERFGGLVRELRSGSVAASPELRERVRAIAAKAPDRTRPVPYWQRFPLPRAALVLAPAVVLVGLGVAVIGGVRSSGSQPVAADQPTIGAPFSAYDRRRENRGAPAGAPSHSAAETATAPPPSKRLQDYRVNMRVRVSGLDALSKATVRAMRVTRSLGGYVASVRYSSPSTRHGDAVLVLRVPIANVQRAVLAYAGLGTLVAQDFSVIDLEKRYTGQVERSAKLRALIAKLEARLETEALTDVERARIRQELEGARATLTVLTRETKTTLNRARLATARLSLTTFQERKQEPAVPPSRFDRMLDDVGSVLVHEAVWALYAVFVAGPFLLLGLLALAVARAGRRRVERRLLAST